MTDARSRLDMRACAQPRHDEAVTASTFPFATRSGLRLTAGQGARRAKAGRRTTMAKMTRRRLIAASGAAAGVSLFAVGRGARRRVLLQARDQSRGRPSAQPARQGSGRPHPAGIERAARHPALSQQSARLRHGHLEPAAFGSGRALHALRPHPLDARAGRLDQRHRLRLSGLSFGVEGDGRRARRLYPRGHRQVRHHRHGAHLGQWLSPYQLLDQGRSSRRPISTASRSACR